MQINNFSDAIRRYIEKKSSSFSFESKRFSLLFVTLTLTWLATGFFSIDADQKGVVLRFGKFTRQANPGLNYKLPSPVETVEKISVTRIKKDVIGQLSGSHFSKESQMLTGDENIIDMHFFVQWRIDSPTNYLFMVKDLKIVFAKSMIFTLFSNSNSITL